MQTPFHLHNKTILVTGASSGIGRQAAISAAAMGALLITTGRDAGRLEETMAMLPHGGHKHVVCDLCREDEVKSIVQQLTALDGVVYAAGIVKPFPVQYLGRKKIDETMHTNFYAAVELTTALLKTKKINDGASLVFLSSISGQYPGKGNSMYAASKAALEAFMKTVAAEYAHKRIRANSLSPAMVKTPMYDASSEGMFEEAMNKHVSKYPLGAGEPEDVANAIVFLLSSASQWITGNNIIMDGGLLLSEG